MSITECCFYGWLTFLLTQWHHISEFFFWQSHFFLTDISVSPSTLCPLDIYLSSWNCCLSDEMELNLAPSSMSGYEHNCLAQRLCSVNCGCYYCSLAFSLHIYFCKCSIFFYILIFKETAFVRSLQLLQCYHKCSNLKQYIYLLSSGGQMFKIGFIALISVD